MKFRRNMAYRAPAAQEYFGMRASDLKAAAAAGDAGAQAELDRREANRKDPTTKAGQRAAKWAEMKAQQGGGAKKPASARDAAVQKAAEEGHLTDADYAAEMGEFDTRAKMAALRARRQEDAALNVARKDLAVLQRAGRMAGNPDPTLARLARAGRRDKGETTKLLEHLRAHGPLGKDTKKLLEREALTMGDDRTLQILQRAGQVKRNGLPYPGAQVLYPQRGIVQGGTGPFYGPTGTLFDRTPDMLWAYANPRRGRSKKNPEILWPKSARVAGVVQGGTSRFYGPDDVPFNNYPDLTQKLVLNGNLNRLVSSRGKRRLNPRMEGETVLWPQPASRVGPIQGGADIYMAYPSAAPFDRMPNFTRTLKNKKRSR
jgi:hypothetical protein